jgi:hypothetical protein
VHKSGERPFFESRQVQRWKFFTAFEAVLVNGAFIIREKMTGDRVQQHHPVAAFFYVLIVEIFTTKEQVIRQVIRFRIVDIYHQAFTTVTAGGTIDPWRYLFVQFNDYGIDLFLIMRRKKRAEFIVFRLIFRGKISEIGEIGMQLDRFQASKLTGINLFSR